MVPRLETINGFSVAAVKAGIKASGRPDLGLIVAERPASAAGVFTRNKIVSPSVGVTKKHLRASKKKARAILVNAGNANTCTGEQGRRDAELSAATVADACGCKRTEVLVCSTGIIGHPLPMKKMTAGIRDAAGRLGRTRAGTFAKAIMTTDLVPKTAGVRVGGASGCAIAGACKGSGMIAPNMATMLGFILTDARIAPSVLQTAVSDVVDSTFNCVTVDGDCSTNDSVLVLASGAAGGRRIAQPSGAAYRTFRDGLHAVCLSLAEQIAADGEGATKLVRVCVTGAKSEADARKAARTVAESPLVKTAMFGNDPNWGRILMAVGRSGCALREERIAVRLCGIPLFQEGAPAPFQPARVSRAMRRKDIAIEIDLGLGRGASQMLTCDFSYDYVKINAEYHT